MSHTTPPHLPSTARQACAAGILLLVSTCLIWIIGSACGSSTSNHSGPTTGKDKEITPQASGTQYQPGNASAPDAAGFNRILWVPAGTLAAGTPVTVSWYPPTGAANFTFSTPPDNPQGPPPFVFEELPVQASAPASPALILTYELASPGTRTLVDTFMISTSTGSTYAAHFTVQPSGGSSTTAQLESLPQDPLPTRDTPDAEPKWLLSQLWFYNWQESLDEAKCNSWVDLIQDPKGFTAISFPVQADSGSMASYTSPLVTRGDTPGYPRFALVSYESGTQELLRMPMKLLPERIEFAENNLPPAPGERWTVMGPKGPDVVCPQGIQIGSGKWEIYAATALHLGAEGCPGCLIRAFSCWEGPEPPFFLRAAAATGRYGKILSFSNPDIACLGPILVQAPGGNAPSIRISGPNFARIAPPAKVALKHQLMRTGMAAPVLITATSSAQSADWKLYLDEAGTQPIVGPVNLPGNLYVWVIGDVGAEETGVDVVTISAVVAGTTERPGINTSFVMIGDVWPASEHRSWLQVASHAPGTNESQWRTDLGLLNPGTTSASARLSFHLASGVLTRTQTVQPGQQVILQDVVNGFASAAGLSPAATGSASLEVVSDQPLKVSSRTYNLVAGSAACYPGGTFGQSYDAFASNEGLGAGEAAWLTQLTENTAYRTNIALTNTSAEPARVAVTLFDGAGGQIGSYNVDLNPGQYKQENKPFATKAGQTNMARGYARVSVTQGSGVITSASVLDNLTNDPTTMPMLPVTITPATRSWVQVASRATGTNQSQWRTDLGVLNPSTQPASVQVRFHKSTGVATNTVSVAPGQQAILVDVVNQIPETGSRALEVVADQPVVVSSRTYNQVAAGAACYPNGTFGQSYDATTTTLALAQGAVAYLPQLQESPAYRTNIALTNTGSTPARVAVTLHNGAGTQIGQYTVDLAAGEYKQENRPFSTKAGQTNLTAGYARLSVTQGTGIIASASVVDNLTNDPTTIPAL